MKRAVLVVCMGLSSSALLWACSSDVAYKAPKSDGQFDDGEGSGGPGSQGTRPDASGDAQGRACVANRDCPASHRCVFAVGGGCSAQGACMLYAPTPGCDAIVACGCNNKDVGLCAPSGYSPAPISRSGSCNGPDASAGDSSTTTDAQGGASDSSSDAPSDVLIDSPLDALLDVSID